MMLLPQAILLFDKLIDKTSFEIRHSAIEEEDGAVPGLPLKEEAVSEEKSADSGQPPKEESASEGKCADSSQPVKEKPETEKGIRPATKERK